VRDRGDLAVGGVRQSPVVALLIVVTGPPGAGKSTVARALADEFDRSALIEGDAFFAFVARGAIVPWLPTAHAQNEVVTRAAAAAAGGYAAGGYDTVYDGVVGPWFLTAFAAAAGVQCLHYAVLLPPAGQCLERVASRTGHGFTDQAAAQHMYEEFASSAIDPRHVLPNPPQGASQTARDILRRTRAGTLSYP
jgi:cytidylate kinase